MAEQVKVQEWMMKAATAIRLCDEAEAVIPEDMGDEWMDECRRADEVVASIIARHSPSDEVERLRAIVERLPKTADGVVVLPDDRVWCVTDGGFGHLQKVRVDAITQNGWFSVGPDLANERLEDMGIPTSSDHEDAPPFFSTREACLAAALSSHQGETKA